jgi:hypothetical protein
MISTKAMEILDYVYKKGLSDNLEIRLNYSPMAMLKGKPFSSGYFHEPKDNDEGSVPLMVIGINKPENEWLEVLLHEFCHFIQWKEQTKAWTDYYSLYTEQVHNKEESKELLVATVDMESECEQNTIKLAKLIGYDIDPETYILKVNAYLVFYQIYEETRKWYKKAPFDDEEILSMMPKNIIKNPMDYQTSKDLKSLYLKCL